MKLGSAAQLIEHLEREIVAGNLAAGDRVASIRATADRFGLAPNTVASAYRSLTTRGRLVTRGRRGTFVVGSPDVMAPLVADIPEGLIDLATGEPDRTLLPELGPALAALGGSPTTYGDPALDQGFLVAARSALGAECIPADHIAAVSGAVDGIERVLGAYLRPGDAVAVEDPGWVATAQLVRAMHFVPVPVAVDESGIQADALSEVAAELSAVIVTPRSQNPTGVVTSPDRAEEIAAIVRRHPEIVVVEDDHMGPTGGGHLAAVGPRVDRWAFVRSFAKSLGPDLRLAALTGDEATVNRVQSRQMAGPGWVSHILQRTAAGLLASPEAAELSLRASEEYAERRRQLVEALRRRGCRAIGSTGLNVWAQVDDEAAAVRSANEAGFAIRAGAPFRHATPTAVRISVGRLDPARIDEVAEAVTTPPSLVRARRA